MSEAKRPDSAVLSDYRLSKRELARWRASRNCGREAVEFQANAIGYASKCIEEPEYLGVREFLP